mgnify:CR=1 FL=1
MEVKSIPRLELIQVAEAVSREKSIEKEEDHRAMPCLSGSLHKHIDG